MAVCQNKLLYINVFCGLFFILGQHYIIHSWCDKINMLIMFQFIEYAKIRYCTPPADWSTKNKPGTAEDTVL